MINCLKMDIDAKRKGLLEEIVQLFIKNFGKDNRENSLFRKWLKLASKKYDDDQLIERVAVIIDEGYHKALSLERYLLARIFEINDENGKMSYEQALEIIGGGKLHVGDILYHFSNINHKIGFEGHKGMCLSDSKKFGDVMANIDIEKTVYRHICEVRNPRDIIDHNAKSIAITYSSGKMRIEDILKEAVFIGGWMEEGVRWYELKKSGAIRVMNIEIVR